MYLVLIEAVECVGGLAGVAAGQPVLVTGGSDIIVLIVQQAVHVMLKQTRFPATHGRGHCEYRGMSMFRHRQGTL